VITCGGLGPTEDDVTAQSLSDFLGKPLVFHKATYRSIRRRLAFQGRVMTRLIKRQCLVPEGARVMDNINGTAPGILCESSFRGQKRWLVALPGPPRELEPMFSAKALPLLLRRARIKKSSFILRSLKIAGLIEAEVAPKVDDLLRMKPPATVGIYARPGEVELKIMAKAPDRRAAERLAGRVEKVIRRRLGNKIFGTGDETLASAVGKLLRAKRKTLSTAESCTGGLLSSLITDVSGSSDYYIGGLTAYSNEIKKLELLIPETVLKKNGAVSRQVAARMAQNIRKIYGSDYGIGITGIAGPAGGTPKKPVGLVYIGVASGKKTFSRKFRFLGSRFEIKHRAANTALDLLRLALKTA
ncbi:MAG: CinA family nicotinamide mononucleotide deamidase-related protein, partial [Candidatus Omnitrophota bacterium]